MHKIQEKILNLAKQRDIEQMSLSEVASAVGANSAQLVKYHLDKLKRSGHRFDQTGLSIVQLPDFELISIPIVGSANCGPADIFADERVQGHLKTSSRLLETRRREGLYALRAQGMSMNRARIHGEPINDGDYVIVDSQSVQPAHGDYVVAVVDGLANIKRYYFDPANSRVVFISESTEDYAPIFLHESDQYNAVIAGKVVQVMSRPTI